MPAVLREDVTGRLPEYMVPAALVVMDALPLTVNGKLDREALPAPEYAAGAGGYVAPRTRLSGCWREMFAEVLGVDQVGVDDELLRPGRPFPAGDAADQPGRSVLGAELSIRAVFEHPTVAGLVAALGEGGVVRPAVVRVVRPGRVPLSFAQQRLWFMGQLEGPSATYNIPVAWRVSGRVDAGALRAALGDVAGRHESLRTVFPDEVGVPWQQVLAGDAGRPVLVQERVVAGDVAGAVARAVGYGFDVTAELPVRAWLLSLSEVEHVLVVVVHHIAADGWSMGPLLGDLSVAYEARVGGRAPGWAELPVQYADYTLWQRGLLGSDREAGSLLSGQVGFWREALAGLPEELELPYDRPRPAEPSYRGGAVRLEVDAGLHGGLLGLARERQVTLFMVLHAGLVALLSRCGAGTDIAVGTAVAGRTDEALHDLVGFFVNTLVLRVDVGGDPSFAELLDRVRDADLAAYAHQDVPFERLVEVLNPPRSAARHPLFQVMIAADGDSSVGHWELPGVRTQPEPLGPEAARFDLTLLRWRGARPPTARRAGSVARSSTPPTCSTPQPSRSWPVG